MYATGYLHDTSKDRYHVIYFTEHPFPGGGDQPARRWRSRGHHTTGADDMETAERQMAEWEAAAGVSETVDLGIIDWDGETFPTLNLLTGPDPDTRKAWS